MMNEAMQLVVCVLLAALLYPIERTRVLVQVSAFTINFERVKTQSNEVKDIIEILHLSTFDIAQLVAHGAHESIF